jgi:hypothetical protein
MPGINSKVGKQIAINLVGKQFGSVGQGASGPLLFKYIEEVFVAAIISDTTLYSIIAKKIFPDEIPQKEKTPAIVYQQIATEFFHTLETTLSLRRPTFQFTCWAPTKAGVIQVSEALKTVLIAIKGIYDNLKIEQCRPIDEADVFEPTNLEQLKRKGRRVDFEIWYLNINS